ncbi:Glycosyltransferase involved in cell wall bisynthesis [Flavobacterium noncentrifugens]|uniref:Glycosyltransferase involved in cell wall bisynthesis n=2 Tax=Flavobacterium noncentrifugens TaxID=1128970 RepID=A0A1G8YUH8_9FLAO|nr:Glycosyltransferase involved in cell wall bisynthesis [Flavobacterium noncentrifugens]
MKNDNILRNNGTPPGFLPFMNNNFFNEQKKPLKVPVDENMLPEILFITTFPPRECGIATYSQDLINALNKQFVYSFNIEICAVENNSERHTYGKDVKYKLNTSEPKSYIKMAEKINADDNIKVVLIQHEFGLFAETVDEFNDFVSRIKKPLGIVFHTVLPRPDEVFKQKVQHLLDYADGIIVMTHGAGEILERDYRVDSSKINVIAHGTHLVPHLDKNVLKEKYGLQGRRVLSTFGLLSSGKSIETTLEALPGIVKTTPEVIFLIIGKTHPTVALQEGEKYREELQRKIVELNIQDNVKFVNKYLPLDELLEYLQLTDIYLFTSKDPNQAVSGTFSYALSCGCPVVSTPIPHAKEVLSGESGILFDFGDSKQLKEAVNKLLFDEELRLNIISNGLHKITCTAWENSAVAHAKFLQKIARNKFELHYRNPDINLDHIKKMTTDFGMLQFAKINVPDINSGYTIDDNARAMIALCQHYKMTREEDDLLYIKIYLDFIAYCERPKDLFLNYVDYNNNFTTQNAEVNLADSTGRAIWALGYLISLAHILPYEIVSKAEKVFDRAVQCATKVHSPRAMSFIIKGLYYYNRSVENDNTSEITKMLADRLVQMYKHESSPDWLWFESYLTYANSILPEALLCAYTITDDTTYKAIAKESFDFLMAKTFSDSEIKVITNQGWCQKGEENSGFGEQPIDVAYTIITLRKFHDVFKEKSYLDKMETAFNWFLGNNHLQQIIYNPCTGGCFDGLEEKNVNLNQGAESTVSYLMARLMSYRYFGNETNSYHRRKNKPVKVLH